jgi:azobenzene reductase
VSDGLDPLPPFPSTLPPPAPPAPAGPVQLRVMVVSAISRDSSSCHVLGRLVEEMLAEEPGVSVDFVHPSDVGVPVNDGSVPDDHPAAMAWQQRVAEAHCHIWISPEYHSGMTGAMKNLFDFLGKEPMSGDVVGLVALAGGGMAALNTLNNMSVVARSLGAWVAPEHCALNSNDVKAGLGEGDIRRLRAMLTSVVGMGRRVYA